MTQIVYNGGVREGEVHLVITRFWWDPRGKRNIVELSDGQVFTVGPEAVVFPSPKLEAGNRS